MIYNIKGSWKKRDIDYVTVQSKLKLSKIVHVDMSQPYGNVSVNVHLCICRVRAAESSAFRALKEKLFSHRSELMSGFQQFDQNNTGDISLSVWQLRFDPPVTYTLCICFFRSCISQRLGWSAGICAKAGLALENTPSTPVPSGSRWQCGV